jgi:hypothetical protein
MLLLARDCSIENRFPDKGNYVKLLDHVLIFKKSCGNTIKVRFDHCSLHANLLRVNYLTDFLKILFAIVREQSLPPKIFPTLLFR